MNVFPTLHHAMFGAATGDAAIVRAWLRGLMHGSGGEHVDAADAKGYTVLHNACWSGCEEAVEMLIEAGADPAARLVSGNTPLHTACQEGHAEVASLLLDLDEVDIECCGDDEYSPLYVACLYGHADVVLMLLDRGAALERVMSTSGDTALHAACRRGHASVIRAICDRGCNIELTDRFGLTPLHVLANSKEHAQAAEVLLQYGAAVNGGCEYVTPLCAAAENGHLEKVCMLLSHGAPVDGRPPGGNSPLFLACRKGRASVAAALLAHGADAALANKSGSTPLYVAALCGHADVVSLLLEASGEALAEQHVCAVNAACKKGHVEVVSAMLTHGARVNAASATGVTPLHVSCSHGREEMAEFLIRNGAALDTRTDKGATALCLACERNHISTAALLLSSGASINCGASRKNKPLHICCQHGHTQLVLLLLDQGALDPDPKSKHFAIHVAAQHGRTHTVEALIGRGAAVNVLDGSGLTPLLHACKKGRTETASLLLDYGATPIPSGGGGSPVDLALLRGNFETVAMLLRRGASPNIRDPATRVALREYGSWEMRTRAMVTVLLCSRSEGSVLHVLPLELLLELWTFVRTLRLSEDECWLGEWEREDSNGMCVLS